MDFAELDDIVTRIGAFAGFLEDSLAGLTSRIDALQQNWDGGAATAQAEGFRLWAEGAQDVVTGIAEMRTAATTAHQQYTDAVTLNLRMLGR